MAKLKRKTEENCFFVFCYGFVSAKNLYRCDFASLYFMDAKLYFTTSLWFYGLNCFYALFIFKL